MKVRAGHSQAGVSGVALVELLISTTLAVLVIGATLISLGAVQRSFTASLYQVNSQSDQNRVLSYLRRDLRNASAVQISAQGTHLTLTVPAATKPTLNLNLGLPLLSLLLPAQSAPASSTVRYYRQGVSVIREVGGVATELSTSATRFEASFSGTVVQIRTGFQPRFCRTVGAVVTSADSLVHLRNASQP